jgi:FkbH-like protein
VKFLEAQRALADFKGGPRADLVVAASGTLDPLVPFLRAEWVLRGYELAPRLLPFNTLQQHLRASAPHEPELIVLAPWDLVPELDWRTGIPRGSVEPNALSSAAAAVIRLVRGRPRARVAYLPAPLPPIMSRVEQTRSLAASLLSHALEVGALVLSESDFAMASYLASGCPFSGTSMGPVAELLCALMHRQPLPAAKVLVTDLDGVLWSGLLADDGADGVHHGPDPEGYRHYLYQTLLARLKADGVLLAAVTRNAAEIIEPVFARSTMILQRDDFVAVVASYNAKSAQIRELARQLDLGLDSFVFVDDNPIELAEVAKLLPDVRTLQFPGVEVDFSSFLSAVAEHFPRGDATTDEDAARTDLYRRRLESMAPSDLAGADLTEFLQKLQMQLTIRDCTTGDRQRAVQLINKTNQFNLNGRRLSDEAVRDSLNGGARLITAHLQDRTGSHGEILACLIDPAGAILSLVMSCRVFQRRVEYAFMTWLAQREFRPRSLHFAATEKNEPLRIFLSEPSFSAPDAAGLVSMDLGQFAMAHQSDLALFRLESEGF